MGWANRITLGRAVLTVVLWGLIVYAADEGGEALWAGCFWLFVVAAGTDFVDGMLARRLGEVSVFGRIADPLVDKMLTIGTLIVLLTVPGLERWLPSWMVALIFTREILVTAVRGQIEGAGINFQALPVGKYKMALQCAAAGGLMLCMAGTPWVRGEIPPLAWLPGPAGTWNLAYVAVWAALLLTVVSGVIYALRARRALRETA
jgi:CDP-diacylglycerol--glycerol-3-phosphate 3-phosphatidyltransferase